MVHDGAMRRRVKVAHLPNGVSEEEETRSAREEEETRSARRRRHGQRRRRHGPRQVEVADRVEVGDVDAILVWLGAVLAVLL